jgi:DNA-binding MarR family transcriptional regulator
MLHDELLRRGAENRDAEDDAERKLLDAVRADLVRRRIEREAHEVRSALPREGDNEEPARRRILATLQASPTTNAELADRLGLARETVSRILSALAEEGMVSYDIDVYDRRRKIYRLEESGRDLLVLAEAALGPAPAAPIQGAAHDDNVLSALTRAVQLRRFRYDLPRAEERLRGVVKRANAIGRDDIEVYARRELITTLRQAGKWEEVSLELKELDYIATTGQLDALCIVPAQAHVKYEKGRMQSSAEALAQRAHHLAAAESDYASLARIRPDDGIEDWGLREAWAATGLAEVQREQTEFGKAIHTARRAQQLFEARNDNYGLARTSFLQGFCYRLRGMYEPAREPLARALELSEEHGYDRWVAHALTQMGDLSRCERDFDGALAHLERALEQTRQLPMPLTQAFATSALGATFYELGELRRAIEHLHEAEVLFRTVGHDEGLSLNSRRLAVALRADKSPETALRHSFEAYKGYVGIDSPAGIVTSLMEMIEDKADAHMTYDEEQAILRRYVDLPSPQRLIELDPCAPQMLRDLAERLRDRELLDRSELILDTAKNRIIEDHDSERELLDSLLQPRSADALPAAAVQWKLYDSTKLADVFDAQNVMCIEPRRDTERLLAA